MSHKRLTIAIISLLMCAQTSFAQYNIVQDVPTNSITVEPKLNAERLPPRYTILNDAYLRNRNKMIRQERNSFEVKGSLLFSQYAYSNWAKGGENTFNGKALLVGKHVYKINNIDITTQFDAAYAMGLRDSVMWKTEDRFRVNTALNFEINEHFFYNFNVDVTSQFAKGYSNKDAEEASSKFFAPGKINIGLGFNYKLDKDRSITVSPVSGNILVVNDKRLADEGAFGVDKGKKVKPQVGTFINVLWKQPLVKDKVTQKDVLTYRVSLQSFWNYKQTPDLTWQSWFDFNVYKYFNINFNCTLIFDDQVERGDNGSFWQFSEVLGVGVTYTFKR